MRTSAAEARYEQVAPRPSTHERPNLEVLSGSGLDSLARAGVGRAFLHNAKLIAAIVLTVCALGLVRVGIFAMSAGVLNATATIRSQVEDARVTESNLQIEHSTLSSSGRIDRIATQNYGMVKATENEVMTLGQSKSNGNGIAQIDPEVEPEGYEDSSASELGDGNYSSTSRAGVSEG